jgi:hypothetical protein
MGNGRSLPALILNRWKMEVRMQTTVTATNARIHFGPTTGALTAHAVILHLDVLDD